MTDDDVDLLLIKGGIIGLHASRTDEGGIVIFAGSRHDIGSVNTRMFVTKDDELDSIVEGIENLKILLAQERINQLNKNYDKSKEQTDE